MDKSSTSNIFTEQALLAKIHAYEKEGLFPNKIAQVIKGFFQTYKQALGSQHKPTASVLPLFFDFLEKVKQQLAHPYTFEHYHQSIKHPFNYHRFGIDFLRPLVLEDSSYLLGENHLQQIQEQLEYGHNVVLFANHQIEPDPQAMFILFEKSAPKIIDQLIFVAGERVVLDPVAVPFSLGCNLLCIYSKRYIDFPPEKKTEKQLHNTKTMKVMKSLLDKGGKCIYVAPSGGRDRKDEYGQINPAPFDPQSIEMFYLMARHSLQPTHFYPLALSTYSIFPPPETIQKELGEQRVAKAAAIKMSLGPCLNMESFPGSASEDKSLRRKARSDYIYRLVCQMYDQLT
jgi:glycerol-3-phosphate O-acyltransferase